MKCSEAKCHVKNEMDVKNLKCSLWCLFSVDQIISMQNPIKKPYHKFAETATSDSSGSFAKAATASCASQWEIGSCDSNLVASILPLISP
jgi:hypothetical protein